MSREPLIEVIQKCDAVFKEALDEAKKIRHFDITELASVYLLNLLVRGWRTERPSEYLDNRTVAEQYMRGRFRDAGDQALLISGIWKEMIIRKPVKINYYIGMGTMAYRRESESASGKFSDLFQELSSGFGRMAGILDRAIHHLPKSKVSDRDILKIYGEWLETQNPGLASELVSLGIVPGSIRNTKH